MKKTTKLFSTFLALVMMFTMFGSVTVSAASWDSFKTMWDEESFDNEIQWRYINYMTIVGNKLVAYNYTGTRSVMIPNGVTEIADGVFKNHTELLSINFGDTVKIGKEAFKGCTNLRYVQAYRVSYIDDSAFEDCPSLESVVLSGVLSGATSAYLGKSVFKNDTHFLGFVSELAIQNVQADTFANCPNMTIAYFKTSPTSFSDTAFGVNGNPKVTIYSNAGSAANNFANKYGMKFSTSSSIPTPENTYENAYTGLSTDKLVVFAYQEKQMVTLPSGEQVVSGYRNWDTRSMVRCYNLRGFNYPILRELALQCSKLDETKFNIEYIPESKSINIIFGEAYVPNGTESDYIDINKLIPNGSVTKIPLLFNGQPTNLFAYNFDGRACVIVDQIMGKMNTPFEYRLNASRGLASFVVTKADTEYLMTLK